jgi:hypothetical protein
MSLIHWWPLTEGLQDKIQGIIFNNSGMISNSSGKIGSCYGTSEGHILSAIVKIPSTFSFSCWVKNNDFTYPKTNIPIRFSEGSPYSTPNTTNKGWEFSHGTAGTSYKFTMNDSTTKNEISWTNAQYIGNALLGQWYHMTLTVEHSKKEVTLYINGNNLGTKTYTPGDFGGTFYLAIGQLSGWKLDGYLNDIRIYNHALSKKEVQELSKALVCHYTFEEPGLTPNMFDTTVFLKDTANRCTVTPYGSNGFTMTSTGSDPYIGTSVNSGAGVGALSTWYVGSNVSQVCLSWRHISGPELNKSYMTFLNSSGQSLNTSHNNFGDLIISNGSQRYVLQTLPTGTVKVHVRFGNEFLASGSSITVDNVCLKIGNNPLYSPYALTYSPYNNVGGIVQSTTNQGIYTSSDAGVGKQSLECKGGTLIATPIAGDITQGVTISCWVKGSVPTDSRVVFADYNSKLAFGFFNNGQAIITCAGYGHKCVTDIKTPWTSSWNHIVVRRDSTGAVKCFLNNNELTLDGSQEWTHSSNTFSIGSRCSGGWTSFFNGLVDDVRVYHTALSGDDIKELYSTRWSSNRQGQVFSNFINENQSKFQIARSGVVNCNTINESGNLPNGYIPLQYIQSSGTQFINTNHLATQNTRTIFDYEYLNSSASWAGLFGSDNNPTNNNMGYGLFLNGTTYSCYVSNHTSGGCWNQQVGTWTQNQRTVLNFTHNKLIINSTAYNLKTTTFTTSLVPMYLFSFRRSTGNAGVSSIRLYGCQIWEGSTLVRNFIPAKRADDSVLGLYDTVNNIFYINAGSNSFTAGPAVVGQGRNGNFYVGEFNEI